MVTSPFLLRNNRLLARGVLREQGPRARAEARAESDPAADVARREHVILCGFGRVGQNVARVLESQGFEYIALDLDPARVRNARQAGDPVVYGDSSDDELLRQVGLENASAVVITFADPAVSIGIVRSVRLLRADVPILVRTQDDTLLRELTDAGATEVVPETFEASLMLVSHTLMLLNVPVSRVVRTVGGIRSNRYATLRNIFRRDDALPIDEQHAYREELKSVVVPPGAWAVGRSISEVRARGAQVAFTGVRRQGILGREPASEMILREGDVVVLYGLPESLEHAEAVLLAG
jgi:CPA2 family monovalent cation:H+ antiporter-2